MIRSKTAVLGAFGLATIGVAAASAQPQRAAETPPVNRVAQAATTREGEAPTRSARRQEVRIRVLLLSEKLRDNPEEYIEVGGARYIHFKSPRLKSPARPLEDPKLRYPTGHIEQRNGAVILQLLINEHGWLERADVVCAAPPYERSALESVRGLKFKPAVAREGPVKSYMLVEFGYGKGYPCARIPD